MRRELAAAALLLVVSACSDGSSGTTTLKVLVASSLTDVMPDLGMTYEQAHPGVKVEFVFGGSQELPARIKNADVIAGADAASIAKVKDKLGKPVLVAKNSLTIAVSPGNPKRVRGLRSLGNRRIRVVLGTPTGPIGRYSVEALRKAGVTVTPISEEIDVRTVLSRVRNGEADAGIVYITDMKSAGAAASSVAIPAEANVAALYPAATVKNSKHRSEADAFVAWLVAQQAQSLFHKYGFQSP